jgi:hypothetical protein
LFLIIKRNIDIIVNTTIVTIIIEIIAIMITTMMVIINSSVLLFLVGVNLAVSKLGHDMAVYLVPASAMMMLGLPWRCSSFTQDLARTKEFYENQQIM